MHAGDEMSRKGSIHRMHHNYFYATNCRANCLGSSLGHVYLVICTTTMLKIFWTGLQSRFSAKVRCKLTYLCYHIEIIPKRHTAETSRIGTPPKFIQAEKSRPKRLKFCYLHSYHAEIIWTGLLFHSSAKKRFFFCFLFCFFFGPNLRIIGSSPHSIKMYTKQIHVYASKQDTIGYQENALRTWYAQFQK